MKEEKEVNFLPDELKPKKIKEKRNSSEIEYSSPKEVDSGLLKNGNKKTKAGLWSIFKSKKKNTEEDEIKTSTNLTKPVIKKANVNKAREELLRKIKEQTETKSKKDKSKKLKAKDKEVKIDLVGAPLKNKKTPLRQGYEGQVKKPFFSFISNWSKARRTKKEEKKQKKNMEKMAKQANKEYRALKKKELKKIAPIQKVEPVKTNNPPVAVEKRKDKNILITNLIKGQEFTFFNWRQAITINIISILLVILIIGAGWGYLTWRISQQEVTLSDVQKEAVKKQIELLAAEKEVNKINNLRNKVKEIKNILNNHIYWTNFFTYLENNTLPGVYYNEFVGDLTGEYELPSGTVGFDNYIAQMENWQKKSEYVITATSEGAEISETKKSNSPGKTIEFGFELKVNPKIFLKD